MVFAFIGREAIDVAMNDRLRREAVIEQTQTLIGAPPNSTPSTSPLVRVGLGSTMRRPATATAPPVYLQQRKCCRRSAPSVGAQSQALGVGSKRASRERGFMGPRA